MLFTAYMLKTYAYQLSQYIKDIIKDTEEYNTALLLNTSELTYTVDYMFINGGMELEFSGIGVLGIRFFYEQTYVAYNRKSSATYYGFLVDTTFLDYADMKDIVGTHPIYIMRDSKGDSGSLALDITTITTGGIEVDLSYLYSVNLYINALSVTDIKKIFDSIDGTKDNRTVTIGRCVMDTLDSLVDIFTENTYEGLRLKLLLFIADGTGFQNKNNIKSSLLLLDSFLGNKLEVILPATGK